MKKKTLDETKSYIRHELLTPVTSIYGFSQLIESSNNIGKIKKWNKIVLEECARLTKMIHNLGN